METKTGVSRYSNHKEIIKVSADAFGVSPEDVTGKRRIGNIADARRISAFLIRKCLGYTYTQIGEVLNIDHSTAIYLCRTAQEHYTTSKYFRNKVKDII